MATLTKKDFAAAADELSQVMEFGDNSINTNLKDKKVTIKFLTGEIKEACKELRHDDELTPETVLVLQAIGVKIPEAIVEKVEGEEEAVETIEKPAAKPKVAKVPQPPLKQKITAKVMDSILFPDGKKVKADKTQEVMDTYGCNETRAKNIIKAHFKYRENTKPRAAA